MSYYKKILMSIFAISSLYGCGVNESNNDGESSYIQAITNPVLQLRDGFSSGRPSKAAEVKILQSMLLQLGYNVSIDGCYGNQTATAVAQFQADQNLTVDGNMVNSITYQRLKELSSPQTPGNTGTFNLLDFLTKGERRQGMQNGSPVYIHTDNHKNVFRLGYSNNSNYYKIYTDLWTAKEVNTTIAQLEPLGVVGMNHLGSYNFRNIAGSGSQSRHSFGLAFDIIGFHMNDGRYITVLKDWNKAREGAILRQIRDVLCQNWDVVLSPDYNSSHADHFHIDLNPSLRNRFENTQISWNQVTTNFTAAFLPKDITQKELIIEEMGDLPHEPIDYEAIENEMKQGIPKAGVRAFCR